MLSRKSSQQSGFTLIEVMVAMLIAAVVLLALGQMLIVGIRANQTSEHRMNAAALARSVLSDATAKAASAGYPGETLPVVPGVPSGKAVITVSPNPTVAGQQTSIHVHFTWAERGKTKAIDLSSYTVTQ